MQTANPKMSVENQNDKEIESGIAHDCNDLLMVILGHAELLAMGNLPPETRAKFIQRIESATKQIHNQINRAAHSQVTRD